MHNAERGPSMEANVKAMYTRMVRLASIYRLLLVTGMRTRFNRYRNDANRSLVNLVARFVQHTLLVFSSLVSRRMAAFVFGYAWFRTIDDILDRDAQPPRATTATEYLAARERFFASVQNGRAHELAAEDALLIESLSAAHKLGIDVMPYYQTILEVLANDHRRRERHELFSAVSLRDGARHMDAAAFSAAVVCLGGSESCSRFFGQLDGLFSRLDWFCDLPEDLAKGFVYISAEDVVEFGLDLTMMQSAGTWHVLHTCPGFSAWHRREYVLLQEQLSDLHRGWSTVFEAVFVNAPFGRRIFEALLFPRLYGLNLSKTA